MALTAHVALMRAVNVGGRKAVMSELRAWLAALGFEEARTLLQTGNLVFRSEPTGAELEALLEREAVGVLGYATDFIVRTGGEWRDVLAANPMPEMAKGDPSHLVVMAMRSAPEASALAALQAAIVGREQVRAVGRELFIAYPDGIGTSKLTGGLIERRLGVRGTARNWNTVVKIGAALGS
jgi:uncharacterized protein (DUF1697 family)